MKRLIKYLPIVLIAYAINIIVFANTFWLYNQYFMPKDIKGQAVAQKITQRLELEPSQLDSLVARKILSPYELEILSSDSSVSRMIIWRTILPAYGVYPYPATVYPDLPFRTTIDDSAEQPYLDARAAAVYGGLASAHDDPYGNMSIKEFDTLIHKLESKNIVQLNYISECPYLQNQEWNIEIYCGRNALITGWEQIPTTWRSDFIAQGWDIQFGLPQTIQLQTGQIPRIEASGLIDYSNRIIHLDTSDAITTIHEFTHYATYRVGWLHDDVLKTEFFLEASEVRHILGSYSQTNPREFFAEFASFWILHPRQQPQLQQLAPHTSTRVEQLLTNYTSLIAQPPDSIPEAFAKHKNRATYTACEHNLCYVVNECKTLPHSNIRHAYSISGNSFLKSAS